MREDTPGPEAYDVTLNQRLEGTALEEMRSSLETMASCEGGLGDFDAVDWPFAPDSDCRGGERGVEGNTETQQRRESDNTCGTAIMVGASEAETESAAHATTENVRDRPRYGTCAKCSPLSMPGSLWQLDNSTQQQQQQLPCRDCLDAKASGAANAFLAAASSLYDANLHRRARSTGASVTFGEMPRLRSAPAFSIGRGDREIAARLLHTPGNVIYKEARLGR